MLLAVLTPSFGSTLLRVRVIVCQMLLLLHVDMPKYILVACERSQVVARAFRDVGGIAFSCDVRSCCGGRPDWHILGDCSPYLSGLCEFRTEVGERFSVPRWDLIIACPPCAYLSVDRPRLIGSCEDGERHVINYERIKAMREAAAFFRLCLAAKTEHLCVGSTQICLDEVGLPRPDDGVSLHLWGSAFSKSVWLWLRGLPPLLSGCVNPYPQSWVYDTWESQNLSRVFAGIANAMAAQWFSLL